MGMAAGATEADVVRIKGGRALAWDWENRFKEGVRVGLGGIVDVSLGPGRAGFVWGTWERMRRGERK